MPGFDGTRSSKISSFTLPTGDTYGVLCQWCWWINHRLLLEYGNLWHWTLWPGVMALIERCANGQLCGRGSGWLRMMLHMWRMLAISGTTANHSPTAVRFRTDSDGFPCNCLHWLCRGHVTLPIGDTYTISSWWHYVPNESLVIFEVGRVSEIDETLSELTCYDVFPFVDFWTMRYVRFVMLLFPSGGLYMSCTTGDTRGFLKLLRWLCCSIFHCPPATPIHIIWIDDTVVLYESLTATTDLWPLWKSNILWAFHCQMTQSKLFFFFHFYCELLNLRIFGYSWPMVDTRRRCGLFQWLLHLFFLQGMNV